MRPFAASPEGRKLTQRFAAEVQSRVINPWVKQVKSWLDGLETAPGQRELTGGLAQPV
jgi:hypothetical protein